MITAFLRATVAVGAFSLVGSASAATIAALQDGKTIALIDTASKKVNGSVQLANGASLVGFDVRPSDGKLYGLTRDGSIVIVDHKTGKWEKKSTLSEKLSDGVTYSVDFNPAADRLRVIGSDGTSLRINVEDGKALVDGKLKYAESDASKGNAPMVMGVAYSNSFAGTKETALYDIDVSAGTLLRQAPPNEGTLNTIGKLGVKIGGPVAFDILADGKGGNTGWLITGGALHSVDLATGKALMVGQIAGLKGKTMDLAILP